MNARGREAHPSGPPGGGTPAQSYYEEGQLNAEGAQTRFALYELSLDNEDRGAFACCSAPTSKTAVQIVARVRKHCETSATARRSDEQVA